MGIQSKFLKCDCLFLITCEDKIGNLGHKLGMTMVKMTRIRDVRSDWWRWIEQGYLDA